MKRALVMIGIWQIGLAIFLIDQVGLAGQNVGGGDVLADRFRDVAFFIAHQINDRDFASESLYFEQRIRDFLVDDFKKETLAEDIKHSPHIFVAQDFASHFYAQTEFSPQADVYFVRSRVENLGFRDIARLLIHESFHHMVNLSPHYDDEELAQAVAVAIMNHVANYDPYFLPRYDGRTAQFTATKNYLVFLSQDMCQHGPYLGGYYHLRARLWFPIRKPDLFYQNLCARLDVSLLEISPEDKIVLIGRSSDGYSLAEGPNFSIAELDLRSGRWALTFTNETQSTPLKFYKVANMRYDDSHLAVLGPHGNLSIFELESKQNVFYKRLCPEIEVPNRLFGMDGYVLNNGVVSYLCRKRIWGAGRDDPSWQNSIFNINISTAEEKLQLTTSGYVPNIFEILGESYKKISNTGIPSRFADKIVVHGGTNLFVLPKKWPSRKETEIFYLTKIDGSRTEIKMDPSR